MREWDLRDRVCGFRVFVQWMGAWSVFAVFLLIVVLGSSED